MTSLLANRTFRRRGIAYVLLIAITLILMAFSSSPVVRELQGGVGFAFRPVQSALNDAAQGVTSVFGAITEIDQLRKANAALTAQLQQLTVQQSQVAEIKREYDQLTALLQTRNGFTYQTVAAQIVAREESQ